MVAKHALARQVEFLTDLLEGHRVAAVQPEIQADDILLLIYPFYKATNKLAGTRLSSASQ